VRGDPWSARIVSESEIDLVELARSGPVHFVGIGGAGMAPLAEMLLLAGGRVTGCQDQVNAAARLLQRHGAVVTEGHDPSHVADCLAVVMTAAVPDGHPEIAAARARGIPVLKRARALGAIVDRGTVVGIAGTHGKTTTTTLVTTVLAAAGLDPTGFVGAHVPAWGGNLRRGKDALYVVEADEYDRSFHQLRPSIAVVTTLEADHLDIYGSLASFTLPLTSNLLARPFPLASFMLFFESEGGLSVNLLVDREGRRLLRFTAFRLAGCFRRSFSAAQIGG